MGFHLAVHAGVHQHLPAVHRAPAGHLGLEGQLAGGDRPGAGQPGACRRDRRPAGHVRQSVLRQDERPHLVAAGHAAALDGHRPGGRFPRHPRGRAGTQHRGGPRRMVPRPAVLQRAARRHGGGAARPGPGRSTRPGRRCPGCLHAYRVGVRHLPGQAVHRQPARHVPGAVRDRRVFHPALRGHAEGSPPGQGRQTHLVTTRIRQHILCQSAEEPRLRLGFRQPLHVRSGLRLPGYLSGLLPAGKDRQQPRPRYRSRYSWAHSSSPSSSSPLPSSAANFPTERAGGKSSYSPHRSCTARRCS